MTHLWVRAEQRPNEDRTGLTPEGAATTDCQGDQGHGGRKPHTDHTPRRLPQGGLRHRPAENSWPDAPRDAIILGLKELPDDGTPLPHRHIMFGHAFKGQHSGPPPP